MFWHLDYSTSGMESTFQDQKITRSLVWNLVPNFRKSVTDDQIHCSPSKYRRAIDRDVVISTEIQR